MTNYISSKGEEVIISEMAGPHLIHSIVKVAAENALVSAGVGTGRMPLPQAEAMLKVMKAEAMERMADEKN